VKREDRVNDQRLAIISLAALSETRILGFVMSVVNEVRAVERGI
jgi:hypothetical protein